MPLVHSIEVNETLPLDNDGFAYIIADIKSSAVILDLLPIEGLKSWQANLVRESTSTAAAALFPAESGKHYQVTGWGDYPKFRAGIALFFSSSWRRQRTGTGSFWYSKKEKLSVAVETDQVYAVSWHESHTDAPRVNPVPAANVTLIPEGFAEFAASENYGSPVISCWMVNPAQMLDKMLENEGIPLRFPAEKIFLNLYDTKNDQYEAAIQIQFENASQARGIASVLALAGIFAQDVSGSILFSVFFANPPVLDNNCINIKTALLTEKEIVSLLQMFITNWI